MRLIRLAILYTALVLGANSAAADFAALEALRDGTMKKLNFHAEPKPVSDKPFVTRDGGEDTLSSYKGKYVLLNFWATWCAPCRKEMPQISELQAELGGDNFAVVTLATGRNPPPAIEAFFAKIGVDNLPQHRDPKQAIARDMGVLGLPITVILNPEGMEIARLRGDADWSSDSAKSIINALINQD